MRPHVIVWKLILHSDDAVPDLSLVNLSWNTFCHPILL